MKRKQVQTENTTIAYTHIETNATSICFMFSGAGYTYDKPLLYYATMVMLEKNIDVVHIHYSFKDILKHPIDVVNERMLEVIHPVMEQVLTDQSYKDILFLGKSLGTIPISLAFMQDNTYKNAKMILFTPLLRYDSIYAAIKNSYHQGLLVIGNHDNHFDAQKVEELTDTTLHIEVIEKGDHSLHVEHVRTKASITALSKVMDLLNKLV
ncbi:alpha/beta hydrolase [Aquibacillus koreensis]|uniref:Alpha/beta hydrolase n=1 Tax=Aquibacillus koreensis TaxID=279446 RepID=A0A9X3WP80_9BACI|nr:alpha/beta hydrolase [Aquibacillus koreensis]